MITFKQRIESGSKVRIVVQEREGARVCLLLGVGNVVLAEAPTARELADYALECGAKEVKFDFDLGAHNV